MDEIQTVWVVTDGKAGDRVPCLGVAEGLGGRIEERIVAPRALFAWLMPYGPIDPKDVPRRRDSPIRPPFPDVAIASGRRAAPYLKAIKIASGGRTFTVFLKDPRTGPGAADYIWVPEHDRLRGDNVRATLTSPHRMSPAVLAAARAACPPDISGLEAPRAAVLIGGDSAHFRFSGAAIDRLETGLRALAASGHSLMGTLSRRSEASDPRLRERVRRVFQETGGWLWDGSGENPYAALLAEADLIVVTADSVNMVGEAVATGRPVLVFRPDGGNRKIDHFLHALHAHGAIRPFEGRPERFTYEPLDSTPMIVADIRDAYHRHRQADTAAG